MNRPNRAQLSLAARIGGAALGGYTLASGLSALLAITLPLPPAEAALAGLLTSFLWYALAVLWAFHASSAARVWIGLGLGSALLSLMIWALLPAAAST